MTGQDNGKRGYSAQFVHPVPGELECPVCLLVMREPHLTSCCGNHFCFACINEVREMGNPCPLCKVVITHTLLNRKEKCRILELKVYCSSRDAGCEWTGELGNLEAHVKPMKDKGPCLYTEVKCSLGCAKTMERRHLQSHLESDCPFRLQTCSYCDHKATGRELAEHFETCANYPVICPHLCELSAVPRCKLSAHLDICPNQPVNCPFRKVNCSVNLTRKDLKGHLDLYLQDHLAMVVERLVALEKRNTELEDALEQYEKKTSLLEEKIEENFKMPASEGDDWVSVPDPSEEEMVDRLAVKQPSEEKDPVEPGEHEEITLSPPEPVRSMSASLPGPQPRVTPPSGHSHIHNVMNLFRWQPREPHAPSRRWFSSRRPMKSIHSIPDSDEEDSCSHGRRLLTQLRDFRSVHSLNITKEGCPVLQLKRGNIVSELVECIAAPSDPHLCHDGGCVGVINRSSGGLLQALSYKYVRNHGKLSTGEAVSFDMNGSLNCRYVICVVGPHSRHYSTKRAESLLHMACTAVLNMAIELKVSSLAIPSISAGAYGMDAEVVAQVIIDTCLDHTYPDNCSLEDLRLVVYDKHVYAKFEQYFHEKRRKLQSSSPEDSSTLFGRKRANT